MAHSNKIIFISAIALLFIFSFQECRALTYEEILENSFGGGRVLGAAILYKGVTDRTIKPKAPLPESGAGSAAWPAGSVYIDPAFGSRLSRVSDGNTLAGSSLEYKGRSFVSPSSSEQNAFNSNSSIFYITMNGGLVVPFVFTPDSFSFRRIPDPKSPYGGLTIRNLSAEPEFSYSDPNILYGVNRGKILKFDFRTLSSTEIFDFASAGGSQYQYQGGISVSANEIAAVYFGGDAQGKHMKVAAYDMRANTYHILDTFSSTIDGSPLAGGQKLGWRVHNARIDKTGRYVIITPSGGGVAGTFVWDIQSGSVYTAANGRFSGHRAAGYGKLVNDDSLAGDYGPQWLVRQLSPGELSSPTSTLPVNARGPYFYHDSHLSWNNARPGALEPFMASIYGTRPEQNIFLGDEIVAVATDGSQKLWRFAHHRSVVKGFWDSPRGNVSQDGKYFLFTSNWENTVGAGRTDVFLAELAVGAPSSSPSSSPLTLPSSTPASVPPVSPAQSPPPAPPASPSPSAAPSSSPPPPSPSPAANPPSSSSPPPVSSPSALMAPSQPAPANAENAAGSPLEIASRPYLINAGGTFYLVENGQRKGVANLGLLASHGFELKDAVAASGQDLDLPEAGLLLPGDGYLVKSKQDKTVYLVSNGQRRGFVSAKVFRALGFKFSQVLEVTNPELQALPLGGIINSSAAPHPDGVDVKAGKTIYLISGGRRHPYPSLAAYNSRHKDNDFSSVLRASPADLSLPVGEPVKAR